MKSLKQNQSLCHLNNTNSIKAIDNKTETEKLMLFGEKVGFAPQKSWINENYVI